MSDYSVVHGTKVQNFASDPPAPSIGQVWYNTTTNTSKYFLNAPGSWATENTINNTRSAQAGAGTGTAALLFGGVGNVAHTETWNGTNWTEVNNLNVGRNTGAGCGASNTSALCFAGVPASHWEKTESWNGTNWTELNDLNQGAERTAGSGIATSALNYGGEAPGASNKTELWNGTNWTEVNNLNLTRFALQGAGTSNTSALAFGGRAPPDADTELWNGTNWTEVNNMGTGRYDMGSAGTATLALGYGGKTGPGGSPPDANQGLTEKWNGTSWSEVGNMSVARGLPRGAGTQAAAIAAGGAGPGSDEGDAAESFSSGPATATLGSE